MHVLAYLPSPSQGVWHVGPLPVRAYALCIIAGIVAALTLAERLAGTDRRRAAAADRLRRRRRDGRGVQRAPRCGPVRHRGAAR